MTGLRLEVQWNGAEEVATDELAATWARFAIFVGDDCLTLIRDSVARGYRDTIDVSVYPLAEWVAFNWWSLTTPNGDRLHSTGGGHRLAGFNREHHSLAAVGDGFPWPDLSILPEGESVLITQTTRWQPASRVLEAHGIAGSRLQEEWSGRRLNQDS